ncbi:MAG: hypothetical protein ACJ754_22375 [Pyrinomonadaceae bacterium]
MNMQDDFKYEAAFSFVQKDEQLSLQIADRIRDRLSVFVYSERQEVFAGTDGVDQHSRIYEDEARVVVVLYREEWGQTDWTRVEETAIKNRGFKEGYDYLVFVPLDKAARPKWLPKTRIWVGYERYGIDGVASAIEATVQSEGGLIRSESVADYAARVERELNFDFERTRWHDSENGVRSATQEVERLVEGFKQTVSEITEQTRIRISFSSSDKSGCVIRVDGYSLTVGWEIQYLNTLEYSGLTIRIYKGGLSPYRRSDPIREAFYSAEIDISKTIGWREDEGKGKFVTSKQLIDEWLKTLLGQLRRQEGDVQNL